MRTEKPLAWSIIFDFNLRQRSLVPQLLPVHCQSSLVTNNETYEVPRKRETKGIQKVNHH